jgi:RHS repeat-associated protein
MQMPGRNGSTGDYRYGFQGQETDDEVTGSESHVSYKYRMHDARLGRFLSLDPLSATYPHNSPYAFSENKVIAWVELEGLEAKSSESKSTGEPNKPSVDASLSANVEFSSGLINLAGELKLGSIEIGVIGRHKTTVESINTSGDHNTEVRSEMSLSVGVVGLGYSEALVTHRDDSRFEDYKGTGVNVLQVKTTTIKFVADGSTTTTTAYKVLLPPKITIGKDKYGKAITIIDTDELMENQDSYTWIKVSERNGPPTNTIEVAGVGFSLGIGAAAGINIEVTGTGGPKLEDERGYDKGVTKSAGGGGLYTCFIAGTKVLMATGNQKNIEDIVVGDTVMSYDFVEQRVVKSPVLKVDSPIHNTLVQINFSKNISNQNTDDHPYFVKNKGWCSYNPEKTMQNYALETLQLETGDVCYHLHQSKLVEIQVLSIKQVIGQVRTYNLSDVKKYNNFFANGILVHNKVVISVLNEPENLDLIHQE